MSTTLLTPPTQQGKNRMGLERKSIAVETKIIDPVEGIAQIYVSTTNVEDDVKDIIVPGAYAETLMKRNPKGVAHHDITKPVARTLEATELMPGDPALPPKIADMGAGALRILAQFNLKTQRGRDAFEDVVFYKDEQEYSIGYVVPRGGASFDESKGVRMIHQIDLYEWSPVLFGAAPGTGTAFAKAAYSADREEVSMIGSYEALSHRILDAVEGILAPDTGEAIAGQTISIIGTFPDKVYVCAESEDLKETYFEVPYTITKDGEVVLGAITEVSLETVTVVKESGPILEEKAAVGSHSTPTTDAAWDGPANVARCLMDQPASYYRRIFAWQDPNGDVGAKGTWKFPHHQVSADGTPGAANVKACQSIIGILNGARGGANIPAGDRQGVYRHAAKHLRDAEVEPPELKNFDAEGTVVSTSVLDEAGDGLVTKGTTLTVEETKSEEAAAEEETEETVTPETVEDSTVEDSAETEADATEDAEADAEEAESDDTAEDASTEDAEADAEEAPAAEDEDATEAEDAEDAPKVVQVDPAEMLDAIAEDDRFLNEHV